MFFGCESNLKIGIQMAYGDMVTVPKRSKLDTSFLNHSGRRILIRAMKRQLQWQKFYDAAWWRAHPDKL